MNRLLRLDFMDLSVREESEIWWDQFSEYIHEMDQDVYFQSEEYRNEILCLNQREENPLYAVLLIRDKQLVGLCSYVVYHDENGKSFILEFGIAKPERKKHLGTAFYELIEGDIISRGGNFIDLTAGDTIAESFWRKQRFSITDEKGDNGLFIMRKSLH